MKEKKVYHQRKLAIIEMIEECERIINSNSKYLDKFKYSQLTFTNAIENNARHERIKQYLTERYNRN